MSTSMTINNSQPKCGTKGKTSPCRDSAQDLLSQALKDVHTIVPPLWPLADYVAVNPFFGLTNQTFLQANQSLSYVRNCDLLMSLDYFHASYRDGKISRDHLQAAYAQCLAEYPDWFNGFDQQQLFRTSTTEPSTSNDEAVRFRTVAEAVDTHRGSTWTSHILNDLTRHCSTHYDEGQALWSSPWKGESLYTAWQEAAKLSYRMDLLGLVGFRKFVVNLPTNPHDALLEMLNELHIPKSHWGQFLLCEIFSAAGWSSYVRYQVRQSESTGQVNDDLVGLLAMRLAYDVALAKKPGNDWPLPLWPENVDLKDSAVAPPAPRKDILVRYVWQVAAEIAYQQELLAKLSSRTTPNRIDGRKSLQMVFCIDVRSEVMRRNLESVDDGIETFGFAGSFGMPIEYVSLGAVHGTRQCPAMLNPIVQIHETVFDQPKSTVETFEQNRSLIRQSRKLWKVFQSSAASCFSFVESIGLAYVAKLLSDSLLWSKPVSSAVHDGLPKNLIDELGPDIHNLHNQGLTLDRQLDLAESMLRNLGLTSGFARVVALCGHGADVTNNHYRAALDCGACGGHSGKPNARFAAALLNDRSVRKGLVARGIEIPTDTWFMAAVHHTTTDVIEICDLHQFPRTHEGDLRSIQKWLESAGKLCRLERSDRLESPNADDVFRRSRDWAEVRPELGLAGNTAFIVAPRSRTTGIDLGGRAFMHSYDHQSDPDLKVLESIMTAPMVVTNWINMQYYASTVDPTAYGSGNKLIHNIVGQFGVLQGNGGDLMTGLPWQSVHDGKQYLHEPLRLLVVIDALRSSVQTIIERQPLVRDLVTNGWMTLTVWEGSRFYRWNAKQMWEAVPAEFPAIRNRLEPSQN